MPNYFGNASQKHKKACIDNSILPPVLTITTYITRIIIWRHSDVTIVCRHLGFFWARGVQRCSSVQPWRQRTWSLWRHRWLSHSQLVLSSLRSNQGTVQLAFKLTPTSDACKYRLIVCLISVHRLSVCFQGYIFDRIRGLQDVQDGWK